MCAALLLLLWMSMSLSFVAGLLCRSPFLSLDESLQMLRLENEVRATR